jgi:hypothetical protein
MIVYLAFFRPPKKAIKFHGATVRRPTDDENNQFIDCAFVPYIRPLDHTEVFGPLDKLRVPAKVKVIYTILEVRDYHISPICYIALLDVLTKNWIYILEREKHCRLRPLSLGRSMPAGTHPKVPTYNFNPNLIEKLKAGLLLLSSQRRFCISLERWYSSCTRMEPLDTVLDCCSSLEAVLSLPDELRLRIAFSVYHTVKTNKKRAFALAYEMYGIRNAFIHGGKMPKVSLSQKRSYIELVAEILYRYVAIGKILDGGVISKMILENYAEPNRTEIKSQKTTKSNK